MRTPCFSLIQGLSGHVPKQEKENRSKNRVCVVVPSRGLVNYGEPRTKALSTLPPTQRSQVHLRR